MFILSFENINSEVETVLEAIQIFNVYTLYQYTAYSYTTGCEYHR